MYRAQNANRPARPADRAVESAGQTRPAGQRHEIQVRGQRGHTGWWQEPGPAFAASWEKQTGQAARLIMRSRLGRLGDLLPPDPAPGGCAP